MDKPIFMLTSVDRYLLKFDTDLIGGFKPVSLLKDTTGKQKLRVLNSA